MFRTIVVGVDGRQGGRDAIALARALAAPTGARLVLAHAYLGGGDLPRGTDAGFDHVLREEAAAMVRAEREVLALEADVVALPDLHAARSLQRVAEEEEADLLVVGSSHRGPLGRVLLGDVARDVLHGAPCPVAVAPHGTPATDAIALRRVGVGFDGSPEARGALRLGAELAAATRGELTLVGAVTEPSAYTPAYSMSLSWAEVVGRQQQELQATIDEAVAAAAVPASGVVSTGGPVAALEAASERLDVLVLGSRSFGPVKRVLLGSTSNALVERARCPLIVVPRMATPGDEDTPAGDLAAAAR